jgi:hypothetical protein
LRSFFFLPVGYLASIALEVVVDFIWFPGTGTIIM